MKEFIQIKSRIDNINLVLNIPERWNNEKLMLTCHGFDSGRDSQGLVKFEEDIAKNGIACARFSLPYHAERRNNPNDLTVDNCIEDMEKVEKEIRKRYPNAKIGICSTSFGAYLTLLKLKRRENNYFSIILKSPAIKMDEILVNTLIDDDYEKFKEKRYSVRYKKETPMIVTYGFYEDLMENKIFDLGKYDEKMLIYHAIDDDTAPCEDTQRFANENPNSKLILLKNEFHRFTFKKLDELHVEMVNWINTGNFNDYKTLIKEDENER